MPNRIDTSTIPRIGVYKEIIESAALVPDTSQDTLDKAVSTMKADIDDINSQWKNLILTVSLMNGLSLCMAVFNGSLVMMALLPFLTFLTLFLNKMRLDVIELENPVKALTEDKENVAPFTPANSGIGQRRCTPSRIIR